LNLLIRNANTLLIVFSRASLCEMEVELELLTNEKEEIQVMQKVMGLAKKAKELGFSIKELEFETQEHEEETEKEE
jgi:hypothetical protein